MSDTPDDYEATLAKRYPNIERWHQDHPTAPTLAEFIRDAPCTEDTAARLYLAVLHWIAGAELQIAMLRWAIAAMRAGWKEDGVLESIKVISPGPEWWIKPPTKGE